MEQLRKFVQRKREAHRRKKEYMAIYAIEDPRQREEVVAILRSRY